MTIESLRTIEVAEHGDALSSSGAEAMHKLTVLTNDPTAQIVVVNSRFEAVEKAAGSAVMTLATGIYKVRVQRGSSSLGFEDRLVVLDRDQTVEIAPPQFASAAAIGGSRASDAQLAAREWLDAVVHVSHGEGSKIALLARYAAPAQDKQPLIHPFSGLQLLHADGRLLVNLKREMPTPHDPDTKDPVSICGVKLDPGVYILRHRLSAGQQLEQSVVASKGWQTTVNIRRSEQNVDREKKLFSRTGNLAFLMRRLLNDHSAQPSPMRDSKDGHIDEDQMVEVARQGLADGTRLLRGELYGMFLKKFENPLLGILGALLLDLEREVLGKEFVPDHAALFDEAVQELRKIVGPQHPDVEALSFRCQNAQLAHRGALNAQPMFYRSWRIILEAASSRHNLVPLELWKQTVAAGTMPPYLIWQGGTIRETRLRHLESAAADLSSRRVSVAQEEARPPMTTETASLQAPASPSVGITPSEALRGVGVRSASVKPRPDPYAPELKTKKVPRQQIALELGVPANALQQLIAGIKVGRAPGGGAIKAAGETKATAKRAGTGAERSNAKSKIATKKGQPTRTAVPKKTATAGKGEGSARNPAASKKAKAISRSVRPVSRKGR